MLLNILSIVLNNTYHVVVEAAVYFCSLLYSAGLEIVDLDNGIGILLSVHTDVRFIVEDDGTL